MAAKKGSKIPIDSIRNTPIDFDLETIFMVRPVRVARRAAVTTDKLKRITQEQLRNIRPMKKAIRELNLYRELKTKKPKLYIPPPESRRSIPAALRKMPAIQREGAPLDLRRKPILDFVREPIRKAGPRKKILSPPPAPPGPEPQRTPEAEISWHAYDSPGDASADTQLAVSSTHVVVTTRTTVAYFDKQGNVVKAPFWFGDLFGPAVMAGLKVNAVFDTRSIYDPYRKRFWVGSLGFQVDASGAETSPRVRKVLMAVSVSENPMDGWWLHAWNSGAEESDNSDYLTLGIHEKCIIQSNTAVRADGSGYRSVCIYAADAMVQGKSGVGSRFTGLTNPNTGNEPDFVQPVSHHGPSPLLYLTGATATPWSFGGSLIQQRPI